MNYTQSIGNVIELQCLSKFIEMGFQCSIPYGNSAIYDFIADIGDGKLLRIQCKSSNYVKRAENAKQDLQAFRFECSHSTTNTKGTKKHYYTKNDIDYFATWFNGQVYLVPVEECSTTKTLRFSPPNNGQLIYNKAEDYTIEAQLGHLQDKNFVADLENYKQQTEINIELRAQQTTKYMCSCCNEVEVYKEGSLCPNCLYKQRQTIARPNRETLKKMIRTMSFVSIGKQYNTTDNNIRKWCIAMNLPSTKRDINKYNDTDWEKI